MIKPEDLRIGDFVRVCGDGDMIPKGTICEVETIDSKIFFNENEGCACLLALDREEGDTSHGIWCKDIEGIPITLDFLEKNGFKEIEHEIDEGGFEWCTYEHEDCCVTVQYYPKVSEFSAFYCGHELCDIACVHEFQNILASVKENIKITV